MAQILKTAVLLLVAVAYVVADTNYCTICSDHTMCKYTGVGPKCSPRLSGGVEERDRAAIISAHNIVRHKVAQGMEIRGAPGPQPKAADMRKMVWSEELATIAQRWADQCQLQTDSCRRVTAFAVGQNLHKSSSYGSAVVPEWATIINSWHDNVEKFNRSSISPFQSGNAGSYTQMVWAESYQVGCGYTVFKEAGNNQYTHQIYVCNYGPRGNMLGTSMYKIGNPCSMCPAGTSCKAQSSSSLCA